MSGTKRKREGKPPYDASAHTYGPMRRITRRPRAPAAEINENKSKRSEKSYKAGRWCGVGDGADRTSGAWSCSPQKMSAGHKIAWREAKSGGCVCDGDAWGEERSGKRTGFECVEVCGEKCVEETLPTRRVQPDIVHGAGQDQERGAVQLERAAIIRDGGGHRDASDGDENGTGTRCNTEAGRGGSSKLLWTLQHGGSVTVSNRTVAVSRGQC